MAPVVPREQLHHGGALPVGACAQDRAVFLPFHALCPLPMAQGALPLVGKRPLTPGYLHQDEEETGRICRKARASETLQRDRPFARARPKAEVFDFSRIPLRGRARPAEFSYFLTCDQAEFPDGRRPAVIGAGISL